jgi:hypothetical protein
LLAEILAVARIWLRKSKTDTDCNYVPVTIGWIGGYEIDSRRWGDAQARRSHSLIVLGTVAQQRRQPRDVGPIRRAS